MREVPDAIILCGGAGVRLRMITGDAPKAMAKITARPFLELLFKQLRRNGFERVILAVGYQQNMIRGYFGERACGLRLVYSPEPSRLGTGGALRNAVDRVNSSVAIVMNGDSYIDADLAALVDFHEKSRADVCLVVTRSDGRDDCGKVDVAEDGAVIGFEEKHAFSSGKYLNAGIYMLSRRLIMEVPGGVQVSIETDLLRRWLAEGRSIKAMISSKTCTDIGTPERYRMAQQTLATVEGEDDMPMEDGSV